MILYDGIIFALQMHGGISVLFNELFMRHDSGSFKIIDLNNTVPRNILNGTRIHQPSRIMERYRTALVGEDFDIFHSTFYRLPSSGSSKIVTTVHDYTYERFSDRFRKTVHSWQKNKAIAGSNVVICVSESTRRDLLEFSKFRDETKIVVVYNGVSNNYEVLPTIKVTSQVLFVGSRRGYKNFDSVVYAIAGVPEVELVCVGGGSFTTSELNLLNENIPNRYRHRRFLTNTELNIEYNQSLCLIYPSLYEGFGIPVLEAMRAGCPVIAVNTSSIPEVAGDASILMEIGDSDEIRKAVESLLVDETRNKLVERGLRQSALFSWDKTYLNTMAVYEKLLLT